MKLDLLNPAELMKFDDLCLQFGTTVGALIQDCPNLATVYDQCASKELLAEETSRIVTLALEIKLGFIHTHYDLATLAGLENKHIVPAESRSTFRPLEDVHSFSVALKRSRAAFALIARIRSLWDKVFLYVALTQEGEVLVKKLQGQKSKRRFFFKHFEKGFEAISKEMMAKAKIDLANLESDFRTPELHGFGNIKNWVFEIPEDWATLDSAKIIGHWNVLNRFINAVFHECRTNRDSLGQPGSIDSPKKTSDSGKT